MRARWRAIWESVKRPNFSERRRESKLEVDPVTGEAREKSVVALYKKSSDAAKLKQFLD
jgi:hypothetical protein